MFKISLDNPFTSSIFMLLIGLIGFMYINISNINIFSFLFVLLSIILLYSYFKFASLIDDGKRWKVMSVNTPFSMLVLFVKCYLLYLQILSGGSSSFDDRLTVYGSSFILGISLATDSFLFPIIPIFAINKFIRTFSFYLYMVSFFVSLLLAPSKSLFIGLIFSLLTYRFLKRKTGSSDVNPINLFGVKSVIILSITLLSTLMLLYARIGDVFIRSFLHRVSMNFDNAIYASMISFDKYPENSFFFYVILPLLKRFNSELYALDFYNIPQWILYEVLNIERYGRYGYPNDNFIVGLVLSYKYFAIPIFFVFILSSFLFVKRLTTKKIISPFEIYLLLSIPSFFASTQDFMIKLYTIVPVFYFFVFIYIILPKKRMLLDDNLR